MSDGVDTSAIVDGPAGDQHMVSENTLTVRIGGEDDSRGALRERVRAMERGEDAQEQHVLVLDDEADLHRLLSPVTLELLRAIREHDPGSMRAAADLVDRDFKEVHRNLSELEALNVVEFKQEGRSKRPVVRFDEFDIEVSHGTADSDTATA